MSLYQECTKLKPNWHFFSISDIQSCTYFIIKAFYGVEWIMTFNHMRSVHLQHLNTERKRLKSSSINKHDQCEAHLVMRCGQVHPQILQNKKTATKTYRIAFHCA